MLIYKITNKINNKVYIGQTSRTLAVRIREHQIAAERSDGFYLHNAIKKYGWENFEVCVLAETDDRDALNMLERYYIQKFNSDVKGYNLAPGGHVNCMDSPKVKEHHDSVMRSQAVREKISATMRKRIEEHGISEEHRKHVSEGLKRFYAEGGRPRYVKPFKLSPEHYKALNDAKNKAVYCIDEAGQVIAEFSRVKDAAKWWYDRGYVVKDVNQLCDAIRQSYKHDKYVRGLKWIYRV